MYDVYNGVSRKAQLVIALYLLTGCAFSKFALESGELKTMRHNFSANVMGAWNISPKESDDLTGRFATAEHLVSKYDADTILGLDGDNTNLKTEDVMDNLAYVLVVSFRGWLFWRLHDCI